MLCTYAGDQNLITQLVPAMQNIQNALNTAKLGGKIQVSTVHSMAVMGQSDPPSSGAFVSALGDTMKQLLEFLKENASPFTINPYPFFAYQSDPRPETLAFCLFKPNAGRVDSGSNIKYMNMFDAQVRIFSSTVLFGILSLLFHGHGQGVHYTPGCIVAHYTLGLGVR